MEFGKVETSLLDDLQFEIPKDPKSSDEVLAKAKKKQPKKNIVKIGGAKWGRKDWVGKIYPKGTKEKDFLEYYAKTFRTIEMNSLFYRIQAPGVVEKWLEKVDKDFEFCPKFYQGITHIKRLKNAEEFTSLFLNSISTFGSQLGPSFIQLPDTFGPKNLEILTAYLDSLPKDLQVFVEIRHKEWFLPENTEALFNALNKRNVGWAITDTSGRRDCMHMQMPVPRAFIRFVGNNLHKSDYTRVDAWAKRIKAWKEKGIHSVHFFIHQHDELYAPELSRYTIKTFNKVCGESIPEPHFAEDSESGLLF